MSEEEAATLRQTTTVGPQVIPDTLEEGTFPPLPAAEGSPQPIPSHSVAKPKPAATPAAAPTASTTIAVETTLPVGSTRAASSPANPPFWPGCMRKEDATEVAHYFVGCLPQPIKAGKPPAMSSGIQTAAIFFATHPETWDRFQNSPNTTSIWQQPWEVPRTTYGSMFEKTPIGSH
jgi:hypothetical protein